MKEQARDRFYRLDRNRFRYVGRRFARSARGQWNLLEKCCGAANARHAVCACKHEHLNAGANWPRLSAGNRLLGGCTVELNVGDTVARDHDSRGTKRSRKIAGLAHGPLLQDALGMMGAPSTTARRADRAPLDRVVDRVVVGLEGG